jgi:hypothetical protein
LPRILENLRQDSALSAPWPVGKIGERTLAAPLANISARPQAELSLVGRGRKFNPVLEFLRETPQPGPFDLALDAWLSQRQALARLTSENRVIFRETLAQVLKESPAPANHIYYAEELLKSAHQNLKALGEDLLGLLAHEPDPQLAGLPGTIQDKATLVRLLGGADPKVFRLATRTLPEIRAAYPAGPLTRALVWPLVFEAAPPTEGQELKAYQETAQAAYAALTTRLIARRGLDPAKPADAHKIKVFEELLTRLPLEKAESLALEPPRVLTHHEVSYLSLLTVAPDLPGQGWPGKITIRLAATEGLEPESLATQNQAPPDSRISADQPGEAARRPAPHAETTALDGESVWNSSRQKRVQELTRLQATPAQITATLGLLTDRTAQPLFLLAQVLGLGQLSGTPLEIHLSRRPKGVIGVKFFTPETERERVRLRLSLEVGPEGSVTEKYFSLTGPGQVAEAEKIELIHLTLDPFLPPSRVIPAPVSAELVALAQEVDLTQEEISNLDPENLRPQANQAVARGLERARKKGLKPPLAELRALAQETLLKELWSLKNTLAEIEAVTQAARPQNPQAPRLQLALKQVALTHQITQASFLGVAARRAQQVGFGLYDLLAGISPSQSDLLTAAQRLAQGFEGLEAETQTSSLGEPAALATFCDLTLRLISLSTPEGRLDPQALQNIAANLSGQKARQVVGALNYAARWSRVFKPYRRQATLMAQALHATRVAAEILTSGSACRDNHLAKASASWETTGLDGAASDQLREILGQPVLSQTRSRLARLEPPLRLEDQIRLEKLINQITQSARGPERAALSQLLIYSSWELLAALRGEGEEPGLAKIWAALTGVPFPKNLPGEPTRLGERLNAAIRSEYARLAREITTDVLEISLNFALATGSGVSIKKILELLKPGGRLTLDDYHGPRELGPLRGYEPKNAYSLAPAGIFLAAPGSEFSFLRPGHNPVSLKFPECLEKLEIIELETVELERAEPGNSPRQPKPQPRPEGPTLKTLLELVGSLTQSEPQKARVAQALLETGPLLARKMAPLTGEGVHHELAKTRAQVQASLSGQVTVELTNLANPTINFQARIRVDVDGSAQITDLLLERN